MRLQIDLSGDDLKVVACAGVTLESAFIETDAPRAAVFVQRVDVSRSTPATKPPALVKFSDRRYAIPRAESMRLATPRYYREFEGDAEGVRDELEGRYREDVRSAFARLGTVSPGLMRSVTGYMTYGVDGFWIFCTSIRPPSPWQLEELRGRFGAEQVTTIVDPPAFAQALGAAVAAQADWPDAKRSFVDELATHLRPPETGDWTVWVGHGPVCYSDDPAALVESFPFGHRAAIVPFIKRSLYAWQQEYRFSVSINGQPTEDEWFVSIPAQLQSLTKLGG